MKIYVKASKWSPWLEDNKHTMISNEILLRIKSFSSKFKLAVEDTFSVMIGHVDFNTFWNGIAIEYQDISGSDVINNLHVAFTKDEKSSPNVTYYPNGKEFHIICNIYQINNNELINTILDNIKHTLSSSKSSNKWPSPSKWQDASEDDDAFDSLWSTYLRSPEDEVNNQLQIFAEPSIQGGFGDMFIHDESNETRSDNGYPWKEDWTDYLDWQLQAAASSKNAKQYQKKYRNHIKELCGI